MKLINKVEISFARAEKYIDEKVMTLPYAKRANAELYMKDGVHIFIRYLLKKNE